MGHEWMGIVEEVELEVRTIKKGDRVISLFTTSDGTCEFCVKVAVIMRAERVLGRFQEGARLKPLESPTPTHPGGGFQLG